MFRPAIRTASRAAVRSRATPGTVRFASSTSTKKGTWRGTLLRWGAAGGALYWYNTSPLFQDDPPPTKTVPPPPQFSPDEAPTVEAVVAEKRKQAEMRAAARQKALEEKAKAEKEKEKNGDEASGSESEKGGLENLEEEADQQGAFNPETGEINWDCPCLGGMAHGPCGEEFKAAFSCFVYSNEEPKGIDCIDKFQGMQECFRKYPEIYGEELYDDDEAGEGSLEAQTSKAGEQPNESGEDGAAEKISETQESSPVSTSTGEKKKKAS